MNAPELRIRTPEGITFAYQLAGPVTRCLAWAVDVVIIIAASYAVALSLFLFAILSPDLYYAIFILTFFVFSQGYRIVLEWMWRGQTVGKKYFRLRVMDADGLNLQFHQVVLRNLVRFADFLPGCYLVGGVTCLMSRKAQRLGDLAASTIVVYHRKPIEPDLEQLLGNRYNSLRESSHLCARLRQRTTPEEARLALQGLMRRDELDPDARVRLFAELAAHFKEVVVFPTEIVESMPDEQFIRNVVDVLFRTNEVKPPKRELQSA